MPNLNKDGMNTGIKHKNKNMENRIIQKMFLISSLGGVAIIALSIIVNLTVPPTIRFVKNPLPKLGIITPVLAEINVPHKIIKPEMTKRDMREYVKGEIEKVGLNWEEVKCLIDHESNWNTEGWLINEDGKSADRGLWAINSKWHKEVSHACSFNLECSTKEAIRIRKANGNWNQWYGYVNYCI